MPNIPLDPFDNDELSQLSKKKLEEERLIHQAEKKSDQLQILTGNRLEEDTLALSEMTEAIKKDPLKLAKEAKLTTSPQSPNEKGPSEKGKFGFYLNSAETAEQLSDLSSEVETYKADIESLFNSFKVENKLFQQASQDYRLSLWPSEKALDHDLSTLARFNAVIDTKQSPPLSKSERLLAIKDYNAFAEKRNAEIAPSLDKFLSQIANYNQAIIDLNGKLAAINSKWQPLGFTKIPPLPLIEGATAFQQLPEFSSAEALNLGALSSLQLPKIPSSHNFRTFIFQGGKVEEYLRAMRDLIAPMYPILRQDELAQAESNLLRYLFRGAWKSLKTSEIQSYNAYFFNTGPNRSLLTNFNASSLNLPLESKLLERLFSRRILMALSLEFGFEFDNNSVERLKTYLYDLLSQTSLLAAMPAYQLASKMFLKNALHTSAYQLCKAIAFGNIISDLISSNLIPYSLSLLLEPRPSFYKQEQSKEKKEQQSSENQQEDSENFTGKRLASAGVNLTLLAIVLYEIAISLGLPAMIPAILQGVEELKEHHFDHFSPLNFSLNRTLENLKGQIDLKLYLSNLLRDLISNENERNEKASLIVNAWVDCLPYENSESMFKTLVKIIEDHAIPPDSAHKIATQTMRFLEVEQQTLEFKETELAAWRIDLVEEGIISELIKAGMEESGASKIAQITLLNLESVLSPEHFDEHLHLALLKAGIGNTEALTIAKKIVPVFHSVRNLSAEPLSNTELELKIGQEIDLITKTQGPPGGATPLKETLMELLFGPLVNGKREGRCSIVALLKKNIKEMQNEAQHDEAALQILSIFQELTNPHLDLSLLHMRLMDPINTFIMSLPSENDTFKPGPGTGSSWEINA